MIFLLQWQPLGVGSPLFLFWPFFSTLPSSFLGSNGYIYICENIYICAASHEKSKIQTHDLEGAEHSPNPNSLVEGNKSEEEGVEAQDY